MLANFPRDQWTFAMNTRTKAKPVLSPLANSKYIGKHFIEWMKERFGKELSNPDEFQQYLALGGKRQTMASSFRELSPEQITAKLSGETTKYEKVKNVIDSGIGLFEIPSNVSEWITRFAEYERSLKMGHPQTVALRNAADVTIPFIRQGNLGGSLGRALVKSNAFLNPNLQGLSKFFEASKENPTRVATVSGAILTVGIGSMVTTMALASDEQKRLMNNLSPDELSKSIFIPLPDKKNFIRIGVPDQVGFLMGAAQLYVIENYGGNKATFDEYADALTNFIPDQLNITQPQKAFMSSIPTTFRATADVITNTKTYPDLLPVEPEYMKSKLPKDRYTEYTSKMAKLIGSIFNTSPIKIDYWVKNQFGTLSSLMMNSLDYIEGDFDKLKARIPLLRNENEFALYGRSYNNFYNKRELITQQYNRLKGNHNLSDSEANELKNMNQTYNKVGKLITNAHELANNKKMTEELKQDLFMLLLKLDFVDSGNVELSEIEDSIRKLENKIPEKDRAYSHYQDGKKISNKKNLRNTTRNGLRRNFR
jgi:hypothetical protein